MRMNASLLTILLIPLVVLPVGADSGQLATRVARDCPTVSERALSAGARLEEVATVDQAAAEVWVSGEFVRETRIVLWQEAAVSRAEVVQATGEPVCEQLHRLYHAEPSLRADEAASKVDVRRNTFSAAGRPGLESVVQRLREVRLSAGLSATIFAPSRLVRLRVTNRMEEIEVRFNQPEPLAEGVAFSGEMAISQPSVAEWVADLLSVLRIDLGAGPEQGSAEQTGQR